jgi:DNA-binding GntR family transcriptional regulator
VEREIQQLEPVPMLRQRITETLERLIIDGTLAPGQHLVETELASRLGVSRGPVREALQTLHRDGWVELRPRHGAFVRQPTDTEIEEFFHVRKLLEGECARLAAGADETDRLALRPLVAAGWDAVETGDERRLAAANDALHMRIADLAGNATLRELVHLLRKRSQWFFIPVSKPRATSAWHEHHGVVEAIIAGDGARAADQLRVHIEGTRVVNPSIAGADATGEDAGVPSEHGT